jgi:hypothetical protein
MFCGNHCCFDKNPGPPGEDWRINGCYTNNSGESVCCTGDASSPPGAICGDQHHLGCCPNGNCYYPSGDVTGANGFACCLPPPYTSGICINEDTGQQSCCGINQCCSGGQCVSSCGEDCTDEEVTVLIDCDDCPDGLGADCSQQENLFPDDPEHPDQCFHTYTIQVCEKKCCDTSNCEQCIDGECKSPCEENCQSCILPPCFEPEDGGDVVCPTQRSCNPTPACRDCESCQLDPCEGDSCVPTYSCQDQCEAMHPDMCLTCSGDPGTCEPCHCGTCEGGTCVPCDADNCMVCENGNCVSSCNACQTCNAGTCEDMCPGCCDTGGCLPDCPPPSCESCDVTIAGSGADDGASNAMMSSVYSFSELFSSDFEGAGGADLSLESLFGDGGGSACDICIVGVDCSSDCDDSGTTCSDPPVCPTTPPPT